MKASSFLKIGVTQDHNVLLKKTCIYYIYIYNKKKHTGVGYLRYILLCFYWKNKNKLQDITQVVSRDKAGMKASSFLKIGVTCAPGVLLTLSNYAQFSVLILSNMFYRRRQFSKSWTPSFLPYSCSVIHLHFLLFFSIPKKHQKVQMKRYQPLCVSFYYYIYSKCMFF